MTLNKQDNIYYRLGLAVIVIASFALYLIHSAENGFSVAYYDDSGSFFIASDVILRGEIDFLRTPLYPLICHFAAWLSAPHALRIISIMQEAVFLCSIVAIYFAITTLKISRRTALIITAAYALCPILYLYSNLIFSESLSISFVSFLLCTLAKTLFGKHKLSMGIATILLMLIMIMLKPFFICFTPGVAIVLGYSLYRNWQNRRFVYSLSVTAALATSAIAGYYYVYYKTYGKLAMSCVYELNRDVAMYDYGMIKYAEGINYYIYTSPTDRNGDVLTIAEAWMWQPTDGFCAKCDKTYEENKTRYIKNKILDFHKSFYLSYASAKFNTPCLYYTTRLFKILFHQIYLFVIVFALLEAYVAIRQRKNIIFSFVTTSFVAATIFTSIWGAYGDYTRLMIPMMPCLYVMFAIFISRFNFSLSSQA